MHSIIPTHPYFEFYIQGKLMNVIMSFASLYTSVVRLITMKVWFSYLQR